MNPKTIECVQDITELQEVWNTTIKLSYVESVFVTYEWLACWIKVYAPNTKQFIICIKEYNSVIALAPLIILTVKELGLPFRRLQFIGYESCDYMDFIIHKDHPECLELIFDFIQEQKHKWDYCELHDIPGLSENLKSFDKLLFGKNDSFRIFKDNTCPYITSNTSFDIFLNNRKGGFRYQLRKEQKKLEKLGDITFEKISDRNTALKELSIFLDILQKREKSVNRITNSKNIDNRKKIFKQYIENQDMWQHINFSRLYVDNKAIAYHYGFEYNKKLYWYAPTFNIEFSDYAPGKMLAKYCIEYAFTNNLEEFDFLKGEERYKFQWTEESRDNFCLALSSKKLISKLIFDWFLIIKPTLREIFRKIKHSLKVLQ